MLIFETAWKKTAKIREPGGPPCVDFPLRGPTFWNTGNMNCVIQWFETPNGLANVLRLPLLKFEGNRILYSMTGSDVLAKTPGIFVNTTPAKTCLALSADSSVCMKFWTIVDSSENPTTSRNSTKRTTVQPSVFFLLVNNWHYFKLF